MPRRVGEVLRETVGWEEACIEVPGGTFCRTRNTWGTKQRKHR